MGKKKVLSTFERGMVVGCQEHRFECVKNCNAAGFFTLNNFLCIKNGPPPEGHSANGRPAVENGSLIKEAKGGSHELCRGTDGLQFVN